MMMIMLVMMMMLVMGSRFVFIRNFTLGVTVGRS